MRLFRQAAPIHSPFLLDAYVYFKQALVLTTWSILRISTEELRAPASNVRQILASLRGHARGQVVSTLFPRVLTSGCVLLYSYVHARLLLSLEKPTPLSSTSIVGCIFLPARVPQVIFGRVSHPKRALSQIAYSKLPFPTSCSQNCRKQDGIPRPQQICLYANVVVEYLPAPGLISCTRRGRGGLFFPPGSQNSEASAPMETVPGVVAAERRARLCSGTRESAPR